MAAVLAGVAFITEAGSGFGQSAAYSLAHHGVRQLALVDSNDAGLQQTTKTLETRYGVTDVLVLVLQTAPPREEVVEAAVQQAATRFGRIDFAVNNAGFGGPLAGSPDTAPAAFEAHLAQNVTGVWLWHRAELRQMLRQDPRDTRYGRGAIVHVCSVHALAASPPEFAAGAYVAARHAVLGLTRSEGVLYAPQQIRINALCPGYTESPLIESSDHLKALIGSLVRDRVPAGRLATPDEVADAVVFLASPMSSYMFAQALVLDGGYLAQ